MRERVSHRHRRITGRIAACLLVMLAGAAAQAVLAGAASHAEDQTRDTAIDHANQLFILGQNRESGEWVRTDLVKAYMWYLLAAGAGHDGAAAARARVAAGMTAEQITAAQDLARRCLASGYLYCDDRTDR